MKITLYTAPVVGRNSNTHYPNRIEITNPDQLATACHTDHVAATYQNNRRAVSAYQTSDCLVMDIDNDHSDTPAEWATPATLQQLLPDVAFMTATSRNHMKDKGGRTARPRFHAYFPIQPCNNATEYTQLKQQLAARFTIFDANATDAARFLFGNPTVETQQFNGDTTVDQYLQNSIYQQILDEQTQIKEGSRNTTMHRFACRILVRLGNTEEAQKLFLQRAEYCNPPLETDELAQIWHSAARFFTTQVVTSADYISPDQYNRGTLQPDDPSDVGQAQLLVAKMGDGLRYSKSTGWLVYNGTYWEESDLQAHAAAQDLTDRQREEAEQMVTAAELQLEATGAADILAATSKAKAVALINNNPDQKAALAAYEQAVAYHKYAVARRASKSVLASLTEAAPLLEISVEDLDAKWWQLNTPEGTYDLREGRASVAPHNPLDFITKCTSVSPADDGAHLWQQALDTFFCSSPQLIEYVQKIVGLTALGRVFLEQMVIAYGDGRNGKSTFWNVIAKVLGPYAGSLSAEALTVGGNQNVKAEKAELKGKRLVIASELKESTRLSTSTVKQLASTDKVFAEKKYHAPFSFTPSHTLVLYTNHLPQVSAADAGTWRRLVVLPFHAVIEGGSDIKNYAEYLFENAGGAILAWIIEGAKMIIEEDFKPELPEEVKQATDAYREDNDQLAQFIAEECEIGDGLQVKSGDLHAVYRTWAEKRGEYKMRSNEFVKQLEQLGFARRRVYAGKFFQGIALKETEQSMTYNGFAV